MGVHFTRGSILHSDGARFSFFLLESGRDTHDARAAYLVCALTGLFSFVLWILFWIRISSLLVMHGRGR